MATTSLDLEIEKKRQQGAIAIAIINNASNSGLLSINDGARKNLIELIKEAQATLD